MRLRRISAAGAFAAAAALFVLLSGIPASAQTKVLRHDDGRQDDRRSTAGSGHAVQFERPAESFALTSVQIYGSRYGGGYDGYLEVARIAVCDKDLKPIAWAVVPLEKFPVKEPAWVEVPLSPVRPPEKFFVLVDFYATQRKGVYVGIDKDSKGHSISATPGDPGEAVDGEWMIRAAGTEKPKQVLEVDSSSSKVLSYDDGKPDGKRSIAGSGHAVLFRAPSGTWCLTEVSLHGSRYGGGYNPERTLFNVFICDTRMKVLSRSAHPYSHFEAGDADWVKVEIPPVRVSGKFFVLVSFDPTSSKGIFLSIDEGKKSCSLSAMPERPGKQPGAKQNWMIRSTLMKAAKGKSRTPDRKQEKKEGPDAMQIAEWRSAWEKLEKEEDLDGLRKLVEEIRKQSKKEADSYGKTHATENVFVWYRNIPDEYAEAVAQLFERCQKTLKERFGFASGFRVFPGKRLHVHLVAGKGEELRLWTSPSSAAFPLIVNTMPDWKRGLAPPTEGGPHIVYGLCHELGHVLMGWEDSRHQWAHYLGSLLVDDVAKALGRKAWPRAYDYKAEGSARFLRDIRKAECDRTTDTGTARIYHAAGEAFGLETWGKALEWIRKNRKGKPFHAVRRYRLDDLRDALIELGKDRKEVEKIFGK